MHRWVNFMKKFMLLVLSVLLYSLVFSQSTFSASKAEEVRYQVDQNYPPFTYSNDNHVYGFDPDFTNLLFNSTDYKLDYSYDEWPKVYDRIVAGEIDIAGIIAVTDERKKQVLFTDTVFSSSVSVYTRKDSSKIKLEDLKNLKVGVGKGYYTEELLQEKLEITNYVTYGNMLDAIHDLEKGKIDIIFEDHWLMDNVLVAESDKGLIISQLTNLYPLPHAYAVNKNKPELVAYMNKRIRELKKSGIFDEIYVKYFYSHSDYYLENERRKPFLIVAAVLAGALVLFIFLKLYIDLLRKRLSANYVSLKQVNGELAKTHDVLQSQYEEIQAQFEEIQTQYKEIELSKRELEKSEERYMLIAKASNDALWDWNVIEDILYISDKWVNKIGFTGSVITDFSKCWRDSFQVENESEFMEHIREFWKGTEELFSEEVRIDARDSVYVWILIKATLVKDETGKVLRMSGTISDINERKSYEKRIYQLAYYDYLTNIPNRVRLQEELETIIKTVEKQNWISALYYVDLDNFKHINDTLGHEYGDLLLMAVAKELMTLKQDYCHVFRVGGDEFIIIVENLHTNQEILDWAEKILKAIRKEWKLKEGEAYVSASIGITLIPENGLNSLKILKSADAAMYEAKGEGKGKYKIFQEDMLNRVKSRSEMEISIRKAIERQEFQIHYQPYYRISDMKIVGMEALIRWIHPHKGNIPPIEFIGIAEEMGVIREIGLWMLEGVCRQNKLWQDQGLITVPIAVNVSEIQLEDREFLLKLRQILFDTGLEPKYLHIEITESCIMKFIGRSMDVLDEIKNLGIEVALDDFGTGYSSLNYLQNLPIDTVKIDKSFIDEILKHSADTLILSEIISIAHKLKMNVIAEGVEKIEQLEYLGEKECDYMQGFYMSKALPSKQVEEMLKLF